MSQSSCGSQVLWTSAEPLMFCIDSFYYRERDVWFMSAHLFVILRVSGRMCVLYGRGLVCTSINEEHLKGPAGGVCLFDPLRLTAVLCSDAGIRGIIRG